MDTSAILGEIVERAPDLLKPDGSNSSRTAPRPIRAVVGTAFPPLRSDRTYNARPPQGHSPQGLSLPFPHNGPTAHMQQPSPLVEASLEQWDPRDLDKLRSGYYEVPPQPQSQPQVDAAPCGEAYVELWMRFMRSAVHKHRELAVEALRERCLKDAALRERCLRGPDCAQLLHFLIRGGLATGHAATCRAAAECLSYILYDAAEEATEAVGEIAVPPTDITEDKDIAREPSTAQGSELPHVNDAVDSGEATYEELSSWLRSREEGGDGGEGDRARALECLCLSATVMRAAPVLSAPLIARVLLGSNVCALPRVALRMATDPQYINSLTGRMGRVVLGHLALGEMAEELLLLRRVLHVRAAAASLIPQLREALVLLVHYVSTTSVTDTMDTANEAVASLAVFLVLRAAVRHGLSGVFTDASDALLTNGAMSRGAGVAAEMWILARAGAAHEEITTTTTTTTTTTATATVAAAADEEFAREALHQLLTVLPAQCKGAEGDAEGAAAVEDECTALLAGAGAMHYLATYFTVFGGTSRMELAHSAQKALMRRIFSADCLSRAFIRLDSSTAAPRARTTALREALWASLIHGRMRLAAALADTTLNDNATMAFAAAMASRFEIQCMRLTRVAGHLLPDELCTMIEVVGIMGRGGSQFSRETLVAEIFVLHSISLTKHGLDAAPALIASALGRCVDTQTSLPSTAPLSQLAESLCAAMGQSQWPWVIYPLHDTALESRAMWAAWVRRALGADQRMKHVLQWDLLLAHTLAWAVGHRDAAADVWALLEELCAGLLPTTAGAPFSPAACAVMQRLAASAPPHAEAPMPQVIAEAIAIAATACEPSVATALVRLLAAVVEEEAGEKRCSERCGAVLSRWAKEGRLGEADGTAAAWDVENFAELLQAATGDEWARGDAMGVRIARQVADGIAQLYVRQHGSLSTFEKEVVCSSVDAMRWGAIEIAVEPLSVNHMCGFRVTRSQRFLWGQRFTSLLPPTTASGSLSGELLRSTSAGGARVVIESPSDASGLCTVTGLTPHEATNALHSAALASQRLHTAAERKAALDALAELLRRDAAVLSAGEALNTGLCLRDARRSVEKAAACAAACARKLYECEAPALAWSGLDILFTEKPWGNDTEKEYDSLRDRSGSSGGRITLCMSGAGIPLQWAVEAIAAAISCGHSAVWLPSLDAPLSAQWIINILHRNTPESHAVRAVLHVLLCRAGDLTHIQHRDLPGNIFVSAVTNGFPHAAAPLPIDFPFVQQWRHRAARPAMTLVPSQSSVSAEEWASRICREAFQFNARALHPLRIVYVPQESSLLLLRHIVAHTRQLRIGHSLDPGADMGPLPNAAAVDAMKCAIGAAVCCASVGFEQVCGGFAAAMPAGHFMVPCVLYSPLLGGNRKEGPLDVLEETARVCEGLERVGGGPLLIVCAYDPVLHERELEQMFSAQQQQQQQQEYYHVHRWEC